MAGRGVGLAATVAALSILASTSPAVGGSEQQAWRAIPGHVDELYAAPGDLGYAYGPTGADLAALRPDSVEAATFTVTYNGFDNASRLAFQAAVNIWASTIDSTVPIRIRANWVPLGSNILGSAGPTVLCQTTAGVADTWYAAALADKLNGSAFCAALGGQTAELVANFNSSFTGWEFGTTGVPEPGRHNFMTVVLHEIGHGLGHFGRFTSSGGVGNLSGSPSIYDRFAVTGGGAPLLGFSRPSSALHAQLTSNDTFFNGPAATTRNGGSWPKLETHHFGVSSDNGWLSGSSYSHIDDVLYTGTSNGLMTWQLNSAEVYTDVGPIVRGIFEDEGWTIPGAVPGAPGLVSPTGTITATSPTFTWSAVSGAASYQLYVALAGGVPVIDTTVSAAACTGSTCTAGAPTALTAGESYQWWVRASNSAGGGPWSSPLSFAIALPVPPAATVTGPTGTSVALRPAITWNAVSQATYYYVWVSAGSTPVIREWYPSSAACGATTCSVTHPTALAPNTAHTVWVQTWSPAGYGAWSAGRSFTTAPPPVPGTVVTGPTGTAVGVRPAFTWNAVSGITYYYLWVSAGSTAVIQEWYQASLVCGASTCSVTHPTTLAANTAHTAWVQTWSSAGYGPWSAGRSFTTGSAAVAPTLTSPAGALDSPAPTYAWDAVPGASAYHLWVQRSGSAASITSIYQASSVCSGSTCSATPRTELVDGMYSWWVQSIYPSGPGLWSGASTFTLSATVPAAATPVSPLAGVHGALRPTYRWNRVAGATWYYLWVEAPGVPVVQLWYFHGDVCSGATCSATPPVDLVRGGSYRWFLQTWSSRGYGPWNSPTSFSIASETPD